MSVSAHRVPGQRTSHSPPSKAPFGADVGAAHLRWLVRRIADDDHDAFGELFDRLSGPVASALSRQLSDPLRVASVHAGTFVEVWWLAGGHIDAYTDVLAWITDIASRRVADSRSPAPGADLDAANAAALTASWAQRVEAELAGLLARRRTA